MKTPKEVVQLVQDEEVEAISLDHDLGLCIFTGYDVLLWLEEAVANYGFVPPENIYIHTSNPSARKKMEQAVLSIRRLAARE